MIQTALAILFGIAAALLSTFAATRPSAATYADIMGCEISCPVAGAGWPLVFVRDYTGMSVVGTADIFEVLFAADQFDWLPFCADVAFWCTIFAFLLKLGRSFGKARTPRGP